MAAMGLFFEDVRVGDTIRPLVKKSSNVQMFMYAAATWNCDRIHYDYKFAREVFGLGDIVQAGPLSADWYAQMLTEWMGETGCIRSLSYQSRFSIYPDETVICSGKVVNKIERNGFHCIDCELTMITQKGENCSPGKSTIILPVNGEKLHLEKLFDQIELSKPTEGAHKIKSGTLATEEVLKLIGYEAPQVVSDPITAKEIKRYALAIGDWNPIYHDKAQAKKSRYGGIIAPPAFALWACHPVSQDGFVENLTPGGYPERQGAFFIPKLPQENPLHGGDEHDFYLPIRPGDVLSASTKVMDIYEKAGKARAMIFVVTETVVKNQVGKLVDVFKVTMIYY
jgi:acyl dehydratase